MIFDQLNKKKLNGSPRSMRTTERYRVEVLKSMDIPENFLITPLDKTKEKVNLSIDGIHLLT